MGLAAFSMHDWWSEMQTFAKVSSRHTFRTRTPARPEDEQHLNRCAKTPSMMCGVSNAACREERKTVSVPESLRTKSRQLQVHAFELLRENSSGLLFGMRYMLVGYMAPRLLLFSLSGG